MVIQITVASELATIRPKRETSVDYVYSYWRDRQVGRVIANVPTGSISVEVNDEKARCRLRSSTLFTDLIQPENSLWAGIAERETGRGLPGLSARLQHACPILLPTSNSETFVGTMHGCHLC